MQTWASGQFNASLASLNVNAKSEFTVNMKISNDAGRMSLSGAPVNNVALYHLCIISGYQGCGSVNSGPAENDHRWVIVSYGDFGFAESPF